MRPSVSKSSCTTAHQPTENGEAEPQSIERKRIHSAGTSNGRTTCRLLPTIEERAQGDRPVAIEPCGNELLTAGSPQVLLISLHIDVAVVIDLGRNENPLKASLLIADDPVAERGR